MFRNVNNVTFGDVLNTAEKFTGWEQFQSLASES
jgi:hypothetical protein